MELGTLGDVVLLTQAAITVGVLFWLSRDSPKRRNKVIALALGLVVAWVLDHL